MALFIQPLSKIQPTSDTVVCFRIRVLCAYAGMRRCVHKRRDCFPRVLTGRTQNFAAFTSKFNVEVFSFASEYNMELLLLQMSRDVSSFSGNISGTFFV